MNDSLSVVSRALAVKKSYAEGELQVEILRGVNFELQQGKSVAIVGASGSGKSTLLNILGGLEQSDTGSVQMAGQEISTLSEAECGKLRNRYVGFVHQFHHLLAEFTALENVAMPLLIAQNVNSSLARDSAYKLLQQVGLVDRSHHKPAELSGGERQRVAIARALVTAPKCVLADEPTGNLDEATADQVFEIMLKLQKEHTTSLIMVTHNLRLAKQLGSIYRLHDGVLQEVVQ